MTVPRAAWLPAGVLRVVATAACCYAAWRSIAAALTLPDRGPVTDADVERLAQSVAEHLTGADWSNQGATDCAFRYAVTCCTSKAWSTAVAPAAYTRRCWPRPTWV